MSFICAVTQLDPSRPSGWICLGRSLRLAPGGGFGIGVSETA